MVMHTRGKQEDGSTQLGQLITAVRALGDAPVLGHLPKVRLRGGNRRWLVILGLLLR